MAFTRDLSASGLFLKTDLDLPMGSEVQLRISLDGEPLDVSAAVVRTGARDGERGVGLAFRATDVPGVMRHIDAFVRGERLQQELNRTEATRQALARGRTTLESERIALEEARLRLADAEKEAARRVRTAEEAMRVMKQETTEERSKLASAARRQRARAEKVRRRLRRQADRMEEQRREMEEQRIALDVDKTTTASELDELRAALDEERRAHEEALLRERQLAKHVAARRQTEVERDVRQRVEELDAEHERLHHKEGMLTLQRKQLEQHAAALRTQEAELEALFQERCRSFDTELVERERKLEARIAAANVREEDVKRRLRQTEVGANQEVRARERHSRKLSGEKEELYRALHQAQGDINGLQEQLARAVMQSDIFEADAEQAREDQATLTDEVGRLEADLKARTAERDDLQRQIELKAEIIAAVEAEWQARALELEAECEELRLENDGLMRAAMVVRGGGQAAG